MIIASVLGVQPLPATLADEIKRYVLPVHAHAHAHAAVPYDDLFQTAEGGVTASDDDSAGLSGFVKGLDMAGVDLQAFASPRMNVVAMGDDVVHAYCAVAPADVAGEMAEGAVPADAAVAVQMAEAAVETKAAVQMAEGAVPESAVPADVAVAVQMAEAAVETKAAVQMAEAAVETKAAVQMAEAAVGGVETKAAVQMAEAGVETKAAVQMAEAGVGAVETKAAVQMAEAGVGAVETKAAVQMAEGGVTAEAAVAADASVTVDEEDQAAFDKAYGDSPSKKFMAVTTRGQAAPALGYIREHDKAMRFVLIKNPLSDNARFAAKLSGMWHAWTSTSGMRAGMAAAGVLLGETDKDLRIRMQVAGGAPGIHVYPTV
jgi:hypothetical protein